ncbi:MAG: FAD-dependent oxidoreductase [Planctomycetes bacterium]|nr:FAD-dependent oxidoreductase [Planctomycetota bacterium]
MTESPQTVTVLGGGLAGLAAAQRFAENGWKVTVLEIEDHVGGLASSFEQDGYTYDHGPHRLYSNLDELNEHFKTVLDGNWDYRDRLSRIYMRKKFFDYPLKVGNVVTSLGAWTMFRSFLDYFVARTRNAIKPIADDNFEAWIIKRFGRTLYELFFGTYTRKAWGIPCTQISADWAAQRISQLDLWDTVKKTIFRPKNEVRSLVSKFLYPKTGGIGALGRGYERLILRDGGTVVTSAEVVRLESEGGRITGAVYRKDGTEHVQRSDIFVSTMPLTLLIPMLGDVVPAEVTAAKDALVHKGIVFAYVKLDREQLTPDHWIYIPEEHIAVHRISEFTNFSKDCAPDGKTMVCAEITSTKGDAYWTSTDEQILDLAKRNLVELGLLDERDVLPGGFVRRVDYAYPIYDLTYRGNVRTLTQYLKGFENLVSTGRQGLFRYGNMDHSVAMGHAVAKRILEDAAVDHEQIAAAEEYFG